MSALRLSSKDYKTIFLSLLGGAIEVFDFIIFVFLARIIADVFFPPQTPEWLRLMQSMTVFSVGYLARPVGGLIIAHFSDRYGRKAMFNFTILFMAIPCLMIGLLPSYSTWGDWAPVFLLLARLIQGAALGGEVPNAWVFVAEHSPQAQRGRALGLLQAGLSCGYLLGALTITLLTLWADEQMLRQWAWRIPFLLGGALGFISLWLRRWLQETPAFITMNRNQQLSEDLPLKHVWRDYKRYVFPAFMLTLVLASAVIACVVVVPVLLQQHHGIDSALSFKLSCAGILALNLGCVIAGWLADKFGAWLTVALYTLLLPFGVALMMSSLEEGIATLLVTYVFFGFCCGIVGVVPMVMVDLFPVSVKVTGISLIYNLAYSLCSSLLPLILLSLYSTASWHVTVFYFFIALSMLITLFFYADRKKTV